MDKTICIIDYRSGNIKSVQNALNFLKFDNRVVQDPKELSKYSKFILPGVGSFREAITNLNMLGFSEAIKNEVLVGQKQILGICLGMQLLAEYGEEEGLSTGLGLIKGTVSKFIFKNNGYKIPHIGFNNVSFVETNNSLFKMLGDRSDFYFVHSYRLTATESDIVSSWCTYGEQFISSISSGNIHGTQFHPEKSQGNGLQLLRNFYSL